MSNDTLVHDVFLAMSAADRGTAELVRRAFEERGLTVFSDAERSSTGEVWEEGIGPAMAEARIFVVILSRSSIHSPWNLMEIGAAQAWGKAIYLLLDGLREVPAYLARYPAFPISRLSEVVDLVERNDQPLSEDELQTLKSLYVSQNVSSEKLGDRPDSLARLTQRFNTRTQCNLSPERVRSELIRLRKRGELPRLNRRTG